MSSVVIGFPGGGPRQRPPRPLARRIIGDVLRRTRRAQGRTLADVAEQAKVSLPYLSELERGLKEGSSEVLAAVCDALDIELSHLLVQAGRDLLAAAARQDSVIRLDAIRARRALPPAPGAGHRPAAPTMMLAA
jgi:transcriptional regulator with XRE-family HTH domain